MKRLLTLLVLCHGLAASAQPEPPAGDAILIVDVSPESFVDGQESEVSVDIAYNLVSEEDGLIYLSSNELQANAFSPFAHLRVKKGNHTVTLSGKFMPRYWTANAPAKLSVFLRGVLADPIVQPRPLASDETVIALPRPTQPPEKDPKNPNPSVIYEDTVTIKSVSPDRLVEGQETEITATVAYELLSREEGQINLGYSEGHGNGYTIVSETVIKIGSGEATLKARILPAKIGPLPFAKIFVNLSEYPHRQTWSPLANDSQVVEVH